MFLLQSMRRRLKVQPVELRQAQVEEQGQAQQARLQGLARLQALARALLRQRQ